MLKHTLFKASLICWYYATVIAVFRFHRYHNSLMPIIPFSNCMCLFALVWRWVQTKYRRLDCVFWEKPSNIFRNKLCSNFLNIFIHVNYVVYLNNDLCCTVITNTSICIDIQQRTHYAYLIFIVLLFSSIIYFYRTRALVCIYMYILLSRQMSHGLSNYQSVVSCSASKTFAYGYQFASSLADVQYTDDVISLAI